MRSPWPQLELLDQPPRLTEKQQFFYDAVKRARHDGVLAADVQQEWRQMNGKGHIDALAQYDGADGSSVLKALKKKGLVRYRRAAR